jgi:phosphoenolpyruvate phosphomutase
MFHSTPTEVFRKAGVSLVIWANHLIRTAVGAMQETARSIFEAESVMGVEDRIASVNEIFRLQDADELAAAQRRYGAYSREDACAIVLAGRRGEGLRHLRSGPPMTTLSVDGTPLLVRLVESLKKHSIDRVAVVADDEIESINLEGIEVVVNDRRAASDELASLACARHAFRDDMVILYGDLIFRSYVLRGLMESDRELTVVVDSQSPLTAPPNVRDLAYCSARDDRSLWGQDVLLERVSTSPVTNSTQADGRWIGVMRARAAGRKWIEEALDALICRDDVDLLTLGDLLNHVVSAGHPVRVMYIHGHWLDVNSLTDLEPAGESTAGQR